MDLGRAVEAVAGVQAKDNGDLDEGGHSGGREAGGTESEDSKG